MSVHSFLEAAQYLYNENYYEEAFCLVCVALDASAQKQYPGLKVGERYRKFISVNFRMICSKGFPGISTNSIKIRINTDVKNLKLDKNKYVGMEDIIYHVVRCGLVHKRHGDGGIVSNILTDKTTVPVSCNWQEFRCF